MSVYYHTACSYPNCKPEDIINCEAAIRDHKRYMKWHQLKQAVIILSDDDDVVDSPSTTDLSNPPPRLLHMYVWASTKPTPQKPGGACGGQHPCAHDLKRLPTPHPTGHLHFEMWSKNRSHSSTGIAALAVTALACEYIYLNT